MRWTVADEDRHEVDRDAIKLALAGAAGAQLEGRFVPIVRNRAEGISRCACLGDKVRMWAEVAAAGSSRCWRTWGASRSRHPSRSPQR